VLKELNELAPVISRVEGWLASLPADAPSVGIVDLCSGFGFLGMFLAELVQDPERLSSITLVDRGWPNAHIGSSGTISTEHIYDYGPWRVPLHTIKSDIKDVSNCKSLIARIIACNDRPCILCGVHLCGTLSLRACQLFNATTRALALALVPCCMPGKPRGKNPIIYNLGAHTFSSDDFRDCSNFSTPTARFKSWVENVSQTILAGDGCVATLEEIPVMTRRGARHDHEEAYLQDLYIFAHRGVWNTYWRPSVDEEVAGAGGPVVVQERA